jgi:arabinose-5-phosphate isomerase
MAVVERKGFSADDFAELHPRGQLGVKLMRVENLMHTGEEIPMVRDDTLMGDVIYEMSRKGLGVTTVVDRNGAIAGIISDGDLRRQLEKDDGLLSKTARQCMTPDPRTIDRRELATRALAIMEECKITSLLVPDERKGVAGIVHLHDLWRLGSYF